MTILGTRPEVIKMSRIIPLLDDYTNHVLIHTGQNYASELNEVFFRELRLRQPDQILSVTGHTPMSTIAQILEKSDEVLETYNPDAILVLGDTNSALSVISAKRRKIPIFHLEAGNRSFDQRTPEEINRKIVDHVSDINMTYSEHARRNLLQEGLPTDRIFNVGSPMKEIFNHYMVDIDKSEILARYQLVNDRYFVASLHREENVDDPLRLSALIGAISALAVQFDLGVIFSTHPRTKERLRSLDIRVNEKVKFIEALGFLDYVRLQRSAFCVISDSGTLTEESSLLGFPAVTLREAHERPEGTDNGTLIISDASSSQLISSVTVARAQIASGVTPKMIIDYDIDDVSWRVLKIVLSYVGYINKHVWLK